VKRKLCWRDRDGNGESMMLLPLVVVVLVLILTMRAESKEFSLTLTNDSDSYIRVLVQFDGVEVIEANLAPSDTNYYNIMSYSEDYTFENYNGVVITTTYSLSPMTFTVPGTWGNGMELEIFYHADGFITMEGA
jgi:hypothetical protein